MLQRRMFSVLIILITFTLAGIGGIRWYQSVLVEKPVLRSMAMLERQFRAEYPVDELRPDPYYRTLVAGISPADVDHIVLHRRNPTPAEIEVRDSVQIHNFLYGLSQSVVFPDPYAETGRPGIETDFLTIHLRDNHEENQVGKTIEVSFVALYPVESISPEFRAAVVFTTERWQRERDRRRSIFSRILDKDNSFSNYYRAK